MTNHYDPGQIWILIFTILDRLEELERTKVLTDLIWEINSDRSKSKANWKRTEVLLTSYEKSRDESLNAALSNLRELVDVLSHSNQPN